jgi:hypothetical protein
VIPQIADGGGWQTTIVITNTFSTGGSVSLTFFQDTANGNTTAWVPPFLETVNLQNIGVGPSGTVFLHTMASAPIEFSTSSGSISVLALRFNPTGAFTTAPVYPQPAGPIIGGGGGTLPQFNSISISPQVTNTNTTGLSLLFINISSPQTNGTYGSATFGAQAPGGISGSAIWTNVTTNGDTLTFSGFQSGQSTMQQSGNIVPITSATLTVTLTPTSSSATTTGSVTGSFNLQSSLATWSGTLIGTYAAK